MKKITAFIIFSLFFKVSDSQTIDEWLKQKETQKKYLIKQITSFKIYLGYVQKGYSIARKGLNTISDIKKGDFNLHNEFFSSLKEVNPAVKNYSKVADIIAFQLKINQTYNKTYKLIRFDKMYSPEEIKYIGNVFKNLLDHCLADIEELISIITAKELEMKDDERLERIDTIYIRVQDKYAFSKSFSEEAKVLALQRVKERNNIDISGALNGIQNK